MRKSRFSESQIVAILKEGEASVELRELTRKRGISRATYFNWRSKYGGVVIARVFTSVPDLKRKLMRYIRQDNKACRINFFCMSW